MSSHKEKLWSVTKYSLQNQQIAANSKLDTVVKWVTTSTKTEEVKTTEHSPPQSPTGNLLNSIKENDIQTLHKSSELLRYAKHITKNLV